jgi:hypothetical protein
LKIRRNFLQTPLTAAVSTGNSFIDPFYKFVLLALEDRWHHEFIEYAQSELQNALGRHIHRIGT